MKGEGTPEIAEKLKKEERIFIILDDIWARLDLEEVGIPFGDQHEGCKILLTSRNRDVLTNEMDAKKAFPIDDLEEIEAWNLFKETAENDFKDSELRSVATEVAKKCAGLPVAIVTVARALRSKELYAWKDALAQLQRPSPSDMQSGVPAAVYSAIELSYNNLKSEELKQTFLHCGFFLLQSSLLFNINGLKLLVHSNILHNEQIAT
ncbi:NB-ARC - like 10 [Theobroma cacao]|nr:NB-ARC - like 10 [Theobroma cacao]